MSESANPLPSATAPASEPPLGEFASLLDRIGRLALRLAELLEPLEGGEFARGAAFLRAMAGPSESELALRWRTGTAMLERLARAWQLAPAELDLLALAAMPEQHEGYAGIFQSLHPRSEPRPSLGLAAQLLAPGPVEREQLRRLIDEGPARMAGLLACRDDGPFFNRTLELGPGVAPLLHGSTSWPAPLQPREGGPESIDATGLEHWLEQPAVRRAIAALRERVAVDVLIIGEDLRSAGERGRVLAAAAGRRSAWFELDAEQLANSTATPGATSGTNLVTMIGVHTLARDCVAIVGIESSERERPLPSWANHPGPLLLCTTRDQTRTRSPRPVIAVECGRANPLAARQVWAEALPELAEHAEQLAARFPIEPALIREVARDIQLRAELSGEPIGAGELFAAIRLRTGAALRPGMRLRRPSAGWDRLVLAPERIELLREAVARVRHQARVIDDWGFLDDRPGARGVRMLFCGPPGTGKTLSAEVLAHELDTDLLIVDLSRLVSKWIGETEKNLAEVFASAERSKAVLLFDEADALFGKRTEVSDAHDRYANLETAYLLTRLEAYEGLAVLATNMRRNIDAAFMRRLEFVIEYELPGRGERLALWRAHLPSNAPLARDVDLRELADFYPLVGGLIRNAATAAAFLAAADPRGAITRAHLLRAIRREYEKTGAAFPGTPPQRGRT
ncbi:ATP-binding protein [Nannocystaceae bacterium ST9]